MLRNNYSEVLEKFFFAKTFPEADFFF